MKKTIKRLLLLLVLPVSIFALTNKELAISIDLSGKQRMLTQKMTKESFLIRSHIDKKENIEKLTKSSQLFDKTLKGLMQGDSSLKLVAIKNKAIQNQLKKVQELWVPFYKEIQAVQLGKASDSSYDMLEKNNIRLLKEMNKAVGLYAAANKGDNSLTLANDINLAGKQRMLTQKMGKDLLFASNGFKKKVYINDFKASRKLFTQTLDGLFNGSKTLHLTGTDLPKITTQLKVVQGLWKEEQPLLDKALKNKDLKKAIAGLDTILVEMNKGVILYTDSVKRQKQRLQFASIVNSFMQQSDVLKRSVNLSGKQRMLTQRMTKFALLVSLNIDKKANREKLIKFAKLYDKTLHAFKNGDKDLGCTATKNEPILKQIAVIEKAWEPFYTHVQAIVSGKDSDGKSLAYMVDKNEQLLKESNTLVEEYENSNTSKNYLDIAQLHIVNVAGRQRMLTQKMTKEKLLVKMGQQEYGHKLDTTIKLFDDSLTALIHGDANQSIVKPSNKEIKAQLLKVLDIWKPLKPLYEKEKPTTKELAMIIKQNPILLAEMNKMVNMAETTVEY